MALEYLEVDSENIKEIINSKTFNNFKEEQERILNIENVKYEIKEELATDEDGYKNPETKARMVFDDLLGPEKIVFYVDSFVNCINEKFGGKLIDVPQNKEILDKICNTIINLALVHELIHIDQLKKGTLSKEVIALEKDKRYEDRSYEKNAMDLSSREISRYGPFENEVIKILNSNEVVLNQHIDELINLYKK